MNNQTLKAILEETGVRVGKLFSILISIHDADFEDFLEELEEKDWQRLFPNIYKSPSFQPCFNSSECSDLLDEHGKYGFIAQIFIPSNYSFKFENDEAVSWITNTGINNIAYVYSETIEGLVREIKREAKASFKKDVEKAKAQSQIL